MNKYHKLIKKKSQYKEFINVLNGVLELTGREMCILNSLYLLEEKLDKEYIRYNGIMNRETRAKIMLEERMTKSNLSKVEAHLKEKGVLIYNNYKKLVINPLFRPQVTNTGIEIQFILEYNKEKDETITI